MHSVINIRVSCMTVICAIFNIININISNIKCITVLFPLDINKLVFYPTIQ